MAYNPKSKENLKPIKKGEVKNPIGGNAHDPLKKAMRKMSSEVFKDIVDMAVNSDIEGLKRIANTPGQKAITVGIAIALMKAIKTGDFSTMERILQYIIGKPIERVDHTTGGKPIDGSKPIIKLYLPQNGKTKEENE